MHILSVNVGDSRPVTIKNKTIQTGIYKSPVNGPVPVNRYGLQDDVLIEKRKMGREHSAVYAYPFEHYAYWQKELGREEPFPIGQFGENLTVTGLLEDEVRIGDVFRFGNTVLQVAAPRIPCNKLNARMGLRFAPMFLASCKVGFYFRVLEEGTIEKNDPIELLERDENSPTMEEFVRIAHYEYWDAEALRYLLQARDLVPTWREMIEAKLVRAENAHGWHGLREFKVLRREQESEDTVSLYLTCAKGKALAPFHGGQQLMVALGERGGGSQKRQPYYLSGTPCDLSSYRITLRYDNTVDASESESNVSAHMAALKEGDSVLCNAPHGAVRSAPQQGCEVRNPVLISQGLGIAPILSLLYELEEQQVQFATLFHEPAGNEPQQLQKEVYELMARNPSFHIIYVLPGKNLHAKHVGHHVPLSHSDIQVAGSRSFVERMINEMMALDISPAAVVTHNVD